MRNMTRVANLELYDCTNIDILNLNQTATLFADSYLGVAPGEQGRSQPRAG